MPDSGVVRAAHAADPAPLVLSVSRTKSALYVIWALVPALTLGLASVACFAFAAIRLRSRSLGICAAGYGSAAVAFLYLTNSGPQKSWQSNLGVVIGLTATFVATGHAFAIRQRVQDGRVETAEDRAKGRIRQRERCRKLASQNPQLAAELGVGRPDLDTDYDDGGLVDINHVPEKYLTSLPGLDADLAHRIIALRDSIGGFDSLDDLEVLLDLPPQQLEQARDRTVFVR